MLNTCLPSGSLEFWEMPDRKQLCEQLPLKTLGIEFPMTFPVDHTIHMCCHSVLVEELNILCAPAEEGYWKLALVPHKCLSVCKFCFRSLFCNKS